MRLGLAWRRPERGASPDSERDSKARAAAGHSSGRRGARVARSLRVSCTVALALILVLAMLSRRSASERLTLAPRGQRDDRAPLAAHDGRSARSAHAVGSPNGASVRTDVAVGRDAAAATATSGPLTEALERPSFGGFSTGAAGRAQRRRHRPSYSPPGNVGISDASSRRCTRSGICESSALSCMSSHGGESGPGPSFTVCELASLTTPRERSEAIREAARDSFEAYRRCAWGADNLHPLSCSGSQWFDVSLGAVDALSTLGVMGLRDEFLDAAEVAAQPRPLANDGKTNVFEATIRAVGGLLSAAQMASSMAAEDAQGARLNGSVETRKSADRSHVLGAAAVRGLLGVEAGKIAGLASALDATTMSSLGTATSLLVRTLDEVRYDVPCASQGVNARNASDELGVGDGKDAVERHAGPERSSEDDPGAGKASSAAGDERAASDGPLDDRRSRELLTAEGSPRTLFRVSEGGSSASDVSPGSSSGRRPVPKDLARRLVARAGSLAAVLQSAFDTPTGLPLSDVTLCSGRASAPGWTAASSLSEMGSLGLEFTSLARAAGRPAWEALVEGIPLSSTLSELGNAHGGLVPDMIDPIKGRATSRHVTLGSRADSYYEYLLKQWILLGGGRGLEDDDPQTERSPRGANERQGVVPPDADGVGSTDRERSNGASGAGGETRTGDAVDDPSGASSADEDAAKQEPPPSVASSLPVSRALLATMLGSSSEAAANAAFALPSSSRPADAFSPDDLRVAYIAAVRGVRRRLLRRNRPGGFWYVGELERTTFRAKVDHLTCFFPGLLALGAHHGVDTRIGADLPPELVAGLPGGAPSPEIDALSEVQLDALRELAQAANVSEQLASGSFAALTMPDLTLAGELARSCYEAYRSTSTGLAPELWTMLVYKDRHKEGADGTASEAETESEGQARAAARNNLAPEPAARGAEGSPAETAATRALLEETGGAVRALSDLEASFASLLADAAVATGTSLPTTNSADDGDGSSNRPSPTFVAHDRTKTIGEAVAASQAARKSAALEARSAAASLKAPGQGQGRIPNAAGLRRASTRASGARAFGSSRWSPEFSTAEGHGELTIAPLDGHSLLRPETAESFYLLWKTTGDTRYRTWSWTLFQAAYRHARVALDGSANCEARVLATKKGQGQARSLLGKTHAETRAGGAAAADDAATGAEEDAAAADRAATGAGDAAAGSGSPQPKPSDAAPGSSATASATQAAGASQSALSDASSDRFVGSVDGVSVSTEVGEDGKRVFVFELPASHGGAGAADGVVQTQDERSASGAAISDGGEDVRSLSTTPADSRAPASSGGIFTTDAQADPSPVTSAFAAALANAVVTKLSEDEQGAGQAAALEALSTVAETEHVVTLGRELQGARIEVACTPARTLYSSLEDVREIPSRRRDSTESFWLAETLKYLWLTQADEPSPRAPLARRSTGNEILDLDRVVLNTEAHPLRIVGPKESSVAEQFLEADPAWFVPRDICPKA